jgi:CubicO group peptidase (beta-lactamase class C family)
MRKSRTGLWWVVVVRASVVALGSGIWGCAEDAAGGSSDAGADSGADTETGSESESDSSFECAQLDEKFAALVGQLQASLTANGVTGGALALVCGGRVRTAGLGRVQAGGADVTASTLFQLASLTKMLTATAAVSLAKDGAVDLDAPVSDIAPQLAYGEITLDQILSHSAGLPTIFPNEDSYTSLEGWLLDDQNAAAALWAPPGAVWYYNNDGYGVAGGLLEIAGAESFSDLVHHRVFAPFGMTTAAMTPNEVVSNGNFAYGHSGSAASATPIDPNGSYYGDPVYGPMGGAWASADDMAAFMLALLGHGDDASLLQPLYDEHIRNGVMPGQYYGYGLMIDDGLSPKIVSHSGSVEGFLADMELVPEADVGVFAMVNSDWYFPEDVTGAALDAFVDIQDVRPASPESSTRWPLLVGTYDSLVFGQVDVSVVDAGLEAAFVDQGTTSALTPDPYYGYDNYTFSWNDPYDGPIADAPLTFWIDGDVPADYMVSVFGVGARQE